MFIIIFTMILIVATLIYIVFAKIGNVLKHPKYVWAIAISSPNINRYCGARLYNQKAIPAKIILGIQTEIMADHPALMAKVAKIV